MFTARSLFVAFLMSLSACAASNGRERGEVFGTLLAEEGKTNFTIVRSSTAPPSEQRAARELQDYLGQMTGAKFPIQDDTAPLPAAPILVGHSKYTKALGLQLDPSLGEEGFILKFAGSGLVIAGSPARGTLYGVYAFLDRLGVRWFTSTVTYVPRKRMLWLDDLDVRQIPAFEYREPFFTEAFAKDWACRNRCNGNSMQLDESTGGKVQYSRHFVHTFDALIPTTLFATHPEYFPLIKGERKNGYVQRCLSNPDVLKLSIAAVNQWITEEPKATIFSVSQNDCGDWCTCEKCSAIAKQYGCQSGLYLWFVNQVAEAVAKDHPQVLIDTLAYQFTETAPIGIKPRENVRIRLCPISACDAHPYEQCTHPNTQHFVKQLKSWAALTSTLYIWHYNTDFANYLMPFPDFLEFPDSIRLYKRSGVRGIFFEGAYAPGGGGADAELRSWVMARLLWNPDQDERSLVIEWLAGVYGPASEPMRQHFDLIHAPFKDPARHLFIFDAPRPDLFSAELLKKAGELFDEAEKLAETDQQKSDLKKARLGIRYVNLVQHPRTGKELDEFVADVRGCGITQISEGGSVDQWLAAYKAKIKLGK